MEEANKKKRVKRKETAEKTEKKAKRKDRVGKVRRPVSRVAAAKEAADPEIGQLMQSLGLELTDNNQLTERAEEEQPTVVVAATEQQEAAPAKERQPQPARDPTLSDDLRTIVHHRLGALCEESTRSAGEHNERVMSMVQRTMRNAAERGGCECTFECGRDPHVLEPYLKSQRIGFCYNSFEKVYLLYWHKGL